jgi:hypothetical protein
MEEESEEKKERQKKEKEGEGRKVVVCYEVNGGCTVWNRKS